MTSAMFGTNRMTPTSLQDAFLFGIKFPGLKSGANRWDAFSILPVLFLSAVFLLCTSATAAVDRPNILFILVDDLGWRDLACYGHELYETPNIDKLASQSMRFTDSYAACPICGPSRAAILTGKFPSRTGYVDNFISQLSGTTLERSPDNDLVPHIAHSHPGSVIRDGDWKFLRFYRDGREELYNLKDDIGETKNLLASMREKAAEMKAQLDATLKAHNTTIPTAVPAKP